MAQEEETQALARSWRNLQRSLGGEVGLWADPAPGESLHWKLDKTEDPSRRYALSIVPASPGAPRRHIGSIQTLGLDFSQI